MSSLGNGIIGFFGGESSGGGGGLSGSGTANTLSKWASASSLTDSQITDNGTVVAISNWLQFENNSSGYTGYGRIYNFNSLVIGGVTNYSDTTKPYITLGIVGGNNMTNGTTFIQNSIGDVGQTSGTYVNTKVTGRVLSFSGNAEHRFLTITPSYDDNGNTNTYTGTIRGLYYNLTKTTAFPSGANNIAWENVNGDVIFGNLAGVSDRPIMINNLGKISYQLNDFNLYRTDGSQDIISGTSGSDYRFGNLPDGFNLLISTSTKVISTSYAGGQVNGLSLNFDTFVYKFGGFDVASNGTLLQINDSTFTTSLNTDILELSGAIIDNNAPQNVGVKYLVVTLSGVEYSILCTETNL